MLLAVDCILYQVVPVASYASVRDAWNKLLRAGDGVRAWRVVAVSGVQRARRTAQLRSVVMINCGASERITQLFKLPPEVAVYVIDTRRPVLLENVHEGEQVRAARIPW